jgi:orotate phosphoribosyltransferase
MNRQDLIRSFLAERVFNLCDPPITFASGIVSPVYCDNRLVLGLPNLRSQILSAMSQELERLKLKPEVIVGVATGGIPLATLLAQDLDVPLAYVRRQAKSHGTKSLVEGASVKGKRVCLFEDCVTTGESVLDVINILKDADAKVEMILSLFDYGFLTRAEKMKYCSNWASIISFQAILEVMKKDNTLPQAEFDKLMSWHENNTRN